MKFLRGVLVLFSISGSVSAAPVDAQARDTELSADPPKDAKALFDFGLEQGRLGNYEKALEAFEEAFRLSPHHVALFNIGRAAEALGNRARAARAYESFLEMGGDRIDEATRAEVVEKLRSLRLSLDDQTSSSDQLAIAKAEPVLVEIHCPYPGFALVQDRRVIAKSPLSGTLELQLSSALSFERRGYLTSRFEILENIGPFTCRPRLDPQATEHRGLLIFQNPTTGSEILVEGQKTGPRVALPDGPHLVEISAPGYLGSTKLITITRGRTLVLSAKLAPAQEPRAHRSQARKDWGLGLLGGGIAALASSVTLFVYNEQRFQSWQTEANAIRTLPEADVTRALRSQAANARLDDIESIDVAAWAMLASGAALAISGTALLLIPDRALQFAAKPGGATLRVAF